VQVTEKIRAVLFDFNGVIIDDERVHLELFQEILARYGMDLDEDLYWREFLGMDDRGAFSGAWEHASGQPPDESRLSGMIREKSDLYRKRLEGGLPLYDGAVSLIRGLSESLPLGIVSGALREEIRRTLQIAGLEKSFGFIVSAEDTLRGKPDPEGYRIGFEQLKKSGFSGASGDVLVIEDSVQGIEAARTAGMKTFAVGHTYPLSSLSLADRVFGHIREIRPEDILSLPSV
jgi:HAD superfamily hydrolase (TIGR01509 family)